MLRLPLSPLWPGRTVSRRGAPCRRCPADTAPPAPRPPTQLRPASSSARRPAGPREEVEGGPPGQRVSPLPPPPRGERRPQSPGRAPRHGLPRPPQEQLEAAALAAALRSRLFFQAPQERFVRSMADWLPGKADGLAPSTMALIAKYLARHRLREPPLLDCIAAFLLARLELLDSKVIQRLVFPFSRVNYRPSNHAQLFPRLESVLTQKASPLPTVNVLMSLFQLQHFPLSLLRKVFSPAFLISVASSPCGWIMRRYLSLLDAAVTLEVHEYDGPRLDPRYRVQMFDGALTADEANCKYSFKGLVAEALRQLLGEGRFRQDEVLPPGYCTDFLLRISPSGAVLPLDHVPRFSKTAAAARTGARLERVQTVSSDMQNLSPFRLELLGSPTAGSVLSKRASPPPPPPPDCYCSLSKEPSSSSSLSSSTPTSSLPDLLGSCVPGNAICVSCPTWNAVREDSQLLPAGPPASTRRSSSEGAVQGGPQKAEQFQRVVLSVNDKWHYCQNTDILVGSRAMRDRHLRLLGYRLVQLPYTELEKVSGVEEAKHYLGQKLTELRS